MKKPGQYSKIFILAMAFTCAGLTSVIEDAYSASRYYVGGNNGNWNTTASWSASSGGGSGASVPGSGDLAIIDAGSGSVNIYINTDPTVSQLWITGGISVTFTASGANRTLTVGDNTLNSITGASAANTDLVIESNSTLNITGTAAPFSMTTRTANNGANSTGVVAGTIQVNLNGALTAQAAITIGSGATYIHARDAGTIVTANWNSASNCNISGLTANAPAGLSQIFGNINYSSSYTLTLTGGLTIGGNLGISAGTIAGANQSVNLTGNFTGNGGLSFTTGTFNIGGNFTNSGTFTCGTGLVNYNGSAQQVRGTTYNNLTLSGSGTKTTAGVTVNGILSMEGDGSVTVTTLPAYGSAATLQYKGSAAQVTGNEFPAVFNGTGGLIINNSSGVTLTGSKSLSATGVLTMTSGNLTLGDNNLNVTAPLSGAPFSVNKMIVTNGSGSFIKSGSALSDYQITYPVGTAGYYSPMVINTLAASTPAGTISVRAVANRQANVPFENDALQKHWVVITTGLSGISDARVTFLYSPGEVSGNSALYVPRVWNGTSLASPAGATSAGVNPFGVNAAGNTILQGEWTALDPTIRTPFYSYQNGNWNDPNTWTLDPSGTLFTNPSGLVPSSNDKVTINTGHTVTMTTNGVSVNLIDVRGTLDLASTSGHTFTTLSGSGRIRISNADVFPSTTANTFFTTDMGTVEYYGNSFNLTSARTVYNLEINMSAGQALTLLTTPYNIDGNLTVKSGAFRINDNSSATKIRLIVRRDITVNSGASLTTGSGNTLDGTQGNTGAMQFYLVYHSLECYGSFTNNGTVRFTNQAAPVYNAFSSTGAVSLFMKGASDNALTCNGTTDLYNLVIDKGTDQSYKLTVYSSAVGNFRLYGPDGLYDYATGGGFTQENPELRKPLWIRNGTLELTGTLFIPSLTESGGDYYIPANGLLWLNGANVTVWNTDRTNPGASVGGIQGTGVDVSNTGSQSFSIFGNLKVTKGLFTTGSHGIVIWYQPAIFGGITIEGGQCDINGIRTANGNTAGKFSFIQTGGLIRFLGDNGNENMENYASLCLRGTDCSFSMSGGTMEFYDGQNGANDATTPTGGIIRIESSLSNIDVTGGTIKIIRNAAGANNYTIYSTAPFYNLELSGTAANTLTVSANSALTVLNNLTINDFSTLDATAANSNLSIGGNFIIGNTAGTNNAIYNARSNTTTFTGNQNSVITVTNTANAAPLTFYNLTINKTPTSSLATAWSVILSSPGRTETAGTANNHLVTISNDLTVTSGKWNNYRFKTRVQRHIVNAGTILSDATNPGRITLENGGGLHQLTGSTSVVNSFGDIELNDANGAQIYSNISIGNFYLTAGILDINTYNLAITTGITGNTYSTTKMIRSYGSPGSQGITLSLSISGNYSNQNIAVIPLGVGGTFPGYGTLATAKYTPLTINLNGNAGAGPFTGNVNIRPVDEYHPTSDPVKLGDLIPFYWKSNVTGNLASVPSAIVTYSLANSSSAAMNYGGGKKRCYYRSNAWTELSGNASDPLVFNATGFFTTDYTAGKQNSFRSPQFLYSRQSGDWSTLTTWSTAGHGTTSPPAVLNSFDVYEIGGSGGANHQITISTSNTLASGVIIQSKVVTGIAGDPPPTLKINSGLTGNDFNLVSGGGRIILNDGTLPGGEFNDFCNNDTAIFEYSGGSYTLPSGLPVYPNLWISGTAASNKTMPNTDILVRKTLNIYDRTNTGITLTLSSAANGNVTVNDSLVLDNQSKLVFQNSGTARTVTIRKNINCVTGGAAEINSIEVATGGTANLTHQLVVQNNIRPGASTMNLYSANSVVDLVFNGDADSRIYDYAGTSMSLNKLIVNKSTAATRVTIDKGFSLGAATNLASKPLSLVQGILRLNNSSINLILSSGGGDYIIPVNGSLILDQGALSINGNSTGITLNGSLTINGGSVTVYNSSSTNNYIQYSSTGNATLNITGGSLRVGAQIRRFTTTDGGALIYNQTGGTVEVGYNDAPAANRGVFEVLNTGSSFTLTGGTLTIMRGQTGATVPSFYIEPATSNIGSGMTINLGGASGSPQIGIYSSVPLPNIVINGTGTPTVRLWNIPLSVDNNLIINSGAIFDANGLQINIKGNFTNSGNFISNNNTTVFNGSSSQGITGTTTFFNLSKTTASTLNINSNIQISNNLRVENGTLNDNGNTIRALGNVFNASTITYGGGTGSSTQLGIYMNGSISQSVSGNGTFGKITIDNTDGVYLPLGNTILVNNAVRLNQGVFDIQGNLLVLGAGCTIEGSGFNAYKMIQTNISFTDNGIKKYFQSGAQTFTYPIGSNGKYTPLTFNITANSGNTGSITLKAVNERHPSITDDTESGCQLNDLNNTLQYYWTLISNGITGFSGTATMTGLVSDIKVDNTCGLTAANYITARLLAGSTNWNKFTPDKFTESTCQLDFDFYLTDDNGISGDYLAGLDDAIPNSVTVYQTINNGNWTNITIWETIPAGSPIPAGGPRGGVVIINPSHTVDVTGNGNVFSYKTTINGTLNLNTTTQHRLGYVYGTGILKMVDNSTLPAGDYYGTNGFITPAGGTLEYSGSTNYSVLSTIPILNSVTFSGTGNRDLPNNDLLIYGNINITGPTVNNAFDVNMEMRKDLIMTSGKLLTRVNSGNPKITLGGAGSQTINGNFTAANNSNFYSLEINKSLNSVTLGSSVEISNSLQLTSGFLNTTSSNLLILTNPLSSSVSGGSSGSFINGPLRKKIDNGDDFTFPVGKGTRYGNISVSGVQSSVTNYYWTAEYFNSGYSDNSTSPATFNKSTTEYWRINSPLNGYTAKVRLRWDNQSDISPATTAIADIRVAEYNGADWIEKTSDPASGDNNNGTIQTSSAIAINTATDPQYYTLGSTSTVKPTIILGASPQICVGSTSASLPYTATSGNPNQYSVDYNAAANGAGFADISWTALPSSPITLAVPGAAPTGTYNATIQVRSSVTPGNVSPAVSFTVTLSPLPAAITGTTYACVGLTTTLSDTSPGGTWSSSNPAIATISAAGVVTGISAGSALISYIVAGCGQTVSVNINAPPTASISYTGSPWCITSGIQNVTLTGTSGGTFSAPAGLSIDATTGSINTALSSSGTYTVTYTIAASGGCSIVTATTQVIIISDMIWTGTVSTDWNIPANWSCGGLPGATTNVRIPNVANAPVLSAGTTGSVKDLIIDNGSSLTVSGNTLEISGTITNNGTFTATNGTIGMTASSPQVIGANTFNTNTIKNLIINNSNGVSLQGPLNVTGIVNAVAGDLSSSGYLTLVSDASGTALINGSGTGNITGNVTMQRYLPSRFGYKYMSSPFTAATVSEFSNETIASLYRYDENRNISGTPASGWVNYNVAANVLNPLAGYAINFGSSSGALTVDITGIVNNGAQSITLYNHNQIYTQGFNLTGNPYPSPVDWNAGGWTKLNIDNALYFFKASTTDQYGGTYSTFINGISSDGIVSNVIPSMQGFLVHVTNGSFPVTATLAMNNSVRITDQTHPYTKSYTGYSVPLLRLTAGFTDDKLSADPLVIYFDPDATTGFDNQLDALKLVNTDLKVANLYAISSAGDKLSISALPEITQDSCSVPLGLKLNRSGNLSFSIQAIDNSLKGMRVYLSDIIAGTRQDLLPDKTYTINLDKGEFLNRFFLNLANIATSINPDPVVKDDFIVYSTDGIVKAEIGFVEGNYGTVTVYNLTGQLVFIDKVFSPGYHEFKTSLKDGIYIVHYSSGTFFRSKKLFIESR